MRSRLHRGLCLAFAAFLAFGLVIGSTAHPAGAQTVPGQQPGIVVTGFGQATAPAAAAAVQIIIGPDFYGMSPTTTLTETDIAPIIGVVIAAGVDSADIEVVIPATSSQFSGLGTPGSAMLRFEIAEPTDTGMNDLAQGLYQAAADARLGIQHIGVRYATTDCASLQQAATDAAIADARIRAERLATSLGIGLGELVQAMDSGLNPTGTDSCAPPTMLNPSYGFSPYGPGFDPAFNPTAPVEATATAQVTLTFAMAGESKATPVAG
jgi:uncharacterized protein YggE